MSKRSAVGTKRKSSVPTALLVLWHCFTCYRYHISNEIFFADWRMCFGQNLSLFNPTFQPRTSELLHFLRYGQTKFFVGFNHQSRVFL
jgi:hypothetical protein